MEKKELLRSLEIIKHILLVSLIFIGLRAYGEDLEMQNIINDLRMNQHERIKAFDVEMTDTVFNTKPQLLIFVSTSMPMSLLRNYYKEASIYGGTLVFNGLPNGSFKELTKLILDIQETNNTEGKQNAGSVIDDESFQKFGINNVPAFVLYKEEECFEATSCKITYDKVIGNIGIKAALESFADNGDMKEYATGFLK
jgi:type-F conjugative transfer system pilin assembly protein TrbC